jgi:hypothetical protein
MVRSNSGNSSKSRSRRRPLPTTNLTRTTGVFPTTYTKAYPDEVYQPPYEIMENTPFSQALALGKSTGKWLLVNLQDPSSFDCLLLNRDLWRNARVVALTRDHFIFLQYSYDDTLGKGYVEFYLPGTRSYLNVYPNIAIVDPRTGGQGRMWWGSSIPKVADFIKAVRSFLQSHTLDVAKGNAAVSYQKPDEA